MPMPVVQIGIVRMAVAEGRVEMLVGVGLRHCDLGGVPMPVMHIVAVAMVVAQRLVGVQVIVAFA